MIHDHLPRLGLYRPLTRNLGCAIDYLTSTNLESLAAGRQEVDGDRVYAMLFETSTIAGGARFESHRRYIDLQVMLRGRERQKVADTSILTVETPYDDEKDVEFYRAARQSLSVDLLEGQFVIYFPHDGHLPMIAIDGPAPIRKLVLKIRVD